jgi:pyruvate oxidase
LQPNGHLEAEKPIEEAVMSQPKIAARMPKVVTLTKGQTVWWCACGRSKDQPFCDGSHKGTGIEPMEYTATGDGRVAFCQCKHTEDAPRCDGAHSDLEPEEDDAGDSSDLVWYRVADRDGLAAGEVRAVQAGATTVALSRVDGEYGALDSACPHQGGPLGEGSIEEGAEGRCWLRCPWHGWDFDPLTGSSPGGHGDGVPTYPVEERDDGIYVGVEDEGEPVRTVSDVMVDTMVAWGVDTVFGMVGHSNLGFAEAMRRREHDGELRYIGIRHEGAASFAASAYGKLTGRPAACFSIAGPGSTNLLTGLWDARMDRAPILALTGQVNTQVMGPGAFQEIDLASAFQTVAAFSQTVLPGSEHAELVNLACKTAIVERDVAHLILPDEVQVQEAPGGASVGGPDGRVGDPGVAPSPEALAEAGRRINGSSRPVIVVGYGARERMDDVIALADELGAPVLTTFKAKGQIGDDHPLAAGVLGRSGTPVASWFMNECDLMLVFGASFSNHTGITPKKPIVQVDFDPMALGRFHPVEVPVLGEIGVVARALLETLSGDLRTADQRAELAERWSIWREEKARRRTRDRGKGLTSAGIFDALSRHCPEDAIIAVDVGNNTYSFGRYFECRRQRVLMSGYLGSIGFALPAALGAWAATLSDERFAGRKVISVSGDGGLGQYLAEITTAVQYGMDITHVLLVNDELGKISKEQRAGHWPVWKTGLVNPDFAAFATSCGARGFDVRTEEGLVPALVEAIAHDGPALVAVDADADLI